MVIGFFPLSILHVSCHTSLVFSVSAEKSADSFMRLPLYATGCFSLAVLKILSLPLIFDTVIIMSLFGPFCILSFWGCLFFLYLDVFPSLG